MKTAREKLQKPIKEMPKIVKIPKKLEKKWGKGKLLIPNPLDIENLIKGTKKGELITFGQIRKNLTKKFKVDFTCPITTGIFTRLIAEASEEEKKDVPWWRCIRDDGSLNEKFPCSPTLQALKLKKEGHKIENFKSKARVKNFEKFLIK